jgi:hypothetical protein
MFDRIVTFLDSTILLAKHFVRTASELNISEGKFKKAGMNGDKFVCVGLCAVARIVATQHR